MKKLLPAIMLLCVLAAPASAQEKSGSMKTDIAALQDEWAHIKYEISAKDSKVAALQPLEIKAAQVSAAYPKSAEPKIWEAIILSTEASIVRGMSVLGKVEKAKDLLEASIAQDAGALDGVAHSYLGALYGQVPGWPIAFGDDEKAEELLSKGLSLNPSGIDPNYFYGSFLQEQGRDDEAQTYFERALKAPDRAGRALADEGRRGEIRDLMSKLESEQETKEKPDYN